MDFVRYLKKGHNKATTDCTIFNRWADGSLTTEQTIKWFRKNNGIPNRVRIDPEEFREWMHGLGYREADIDG